MIRTTRPRDLHQVHGGGIGGEGGRGWRLGKKEEEREGEEGRRRGGGAEKGAGAVESADGPIGAARLCRVLDAVGGLRKVGAMSNTRTEVLKESQKKGMVAGAAAAATVVVGEVVRLRERLLATAEMANEPRRVNARG